MGRRTVRLRAEMTGYREVDNGPRELRVDIIDCDALTTVASLGPDEALKLASQLLTEVRRCNGRGDATQHL